MSALAAFVDGGIVETIHSHNLAGSVKSVYDFMRSHANLLNYMALLVQFS